ncbi:MAG: (Fe-S)-binding protein [Dehalococcoidia bacterium]|jgi:hypothetical protein
MDRGDIKTKTKKIYEVLPQLDDQKCGYRSCGEFARAVAEAKAPCYGCVSGGSQVAAKVCDIMGVELPQEGVPQFGPAIGVYRPGLGGPGGMGGGMSQHLGRGRGMGRRCTTGRRFGGGRRGR